MSEDNTQAQREMARKVLEEGRRREFMAVLSYIERMLPDAVRIGGEGPLRREAVRLRHDPSLGSPSGDLSAVELERGSLERGDPRFVLTTTFLGLTGAASPLPLYFSEEIIREEESDHPGRDFLDIFHHRLVSLLYRLIAKHDWSREYLSDASDAWSRRALTLAGLDTWDAGLERRARAQLPLSRLLRLVPLRATQGRSVGVLHMALADVLAEHLCAGSLAEEVEPDRLVEVVQFVGRWVDLDGSQQMVLNVRNNRLGRGAILGNRAFHRAGKLRIRLGPLTELGFRAFLPDGSGFSLVREVLRLFTSDPCEYELELVLAAGETPPFVLSTGEPRRAEVSERPRRSIRSRLGRDTWLSGRRERDSHVIVPLPAT